MIKILTDSSYDLPKDTSLNNKIITLPLKVSFKDKIYKDKVDLTTEKFYEYLKKIKELPKTSQVSVSDFEYEFNKILSNKNNKIIVITLSSLLSGTYNSALKAKEIFDTERIYVIDGGVSISNTILVMYANDLIKTNKTIKEIVYLLEEKRNSQKIIFAIETFNFLKRSGRVNNFQSFIGGMFKIKPIIEMTLNSSVKLIDKARGDKQLFKKFLNYININHLKENPISIVYGDKIFFKKAKELKKFIENNSEKKIKYFAQLGAVIASHTGPDLLGISI